jgi:hypothetical protein
MTDILRANIRFFLYDVKGKRVKVAYVRYTQPETEDRRVRSRMDSEKEVSQTCCLYARQDSHKKAPRRAGKESAQRGARGALDFQGGVDYLRSTDSRREPAISSSSLFLLGSAARATALTAWESFQRLFPPATPSSGLP